MSVERWLKNVRISVMEHTTNKQVPWTFSSLTGELVFNAGEDWPSTPPAGQLLDSLLRAHRLPFLPEKLGLSGSRLAIADHSGEHRRLYNFAQDRSENEKLRYYTFLDKPGRTWGEHSINLPSRHHHRQVPRHQLHDLFRKEKYRRPLLPGNQDQDH